MYKAGGSNDFLMAGERILVTGGAGYIGRHVVERLITVGAKVLVIDNFTSPSSESYEKKGGASCTIRNFDLRRSEQAVAIMEWFRPDIVLHLAGIKSVPESIISPLSYYDNNVGGTISLLNAMDAARCKRLVYASSAAVYGTATSQPICETHTLRGKSPYAHSKIMIEQIVADWTTAASGKSSCGLRYFNPIGHQSSTRVCIQGSSLIDGILRVAIGQCAELSVHGSDYSSHDGTGLRDFIHIDDLSDAHISALDFVMRVEGHEVFNVGSGQGTTVLQLIALFESVCGMPVPYQLHERRIGDSAASVSCLKRIQRDFGWGPKRSLDEACLSAWRSILPLSPLASGTEYL